MECNMAVSYHSEDPDKLNWPEFKRLFAGFYRQNLFYILYYTGITTGIIYMFILVLSNKLFMPYYVTLTVLIILFCMPIRSYKLQNRRRGFNQDHPEMKLKASSDMESSARLESLVVSAATTKVIQEGETATTETGDWTPDASETGISALPDEFQPPVQSIQEQPQEPIQKSQSPVGIKHVMYNYESRPSRVAVHIRNIYEFCNKNIFWLIYYAIALSSAITSLSLAVLLDPPASWAAYGTLEVSIVAFVTPLLVKCLGLIADKLCPKLKEEDSLTPKKEQQKSAIRQSIAEGVFDSPKRSDQVKETTAENEAYSSSSPEIVVLSAEIHAEQVKPKSRLITGGEGTSNVEIQSSGSSISQSKF